MADRDVKARRRATPTRTIGVSLQFDVFGRRRKPEGLPRSLLSRWRTLSHSGSPAVRPISIESDAEYDNRGSPHANARISSHRFIRNIDLTWFGCFLVAKLLYTCTFRCFAMCHDENAKQKEQTEKRQDWECARSQDTHRVTRCSLRTTTCDHV